MASRIVRMTLGLFVAVLLLTGCGTDDPAAESGRLTSTTDVTSSDPSESGLDGDTPITASGIGGLEAGMSLADARKVLTSELVLSGFEDNEGYCWLGEVEGLEEDFSLLFLSPARDKPVDNPDDGELGRVSVYADLNDSAAQTDKGVGIGSTKEEVEAAYPGVVGATGHNYVEGGEYLDIGTSDGSGEGAGDDPDGRLLRFETDENGKVTAVHGGLADAVRLVEACS
jgi:hypothetical protein